MSSPLWTAVLSIALGGGPYPTQVSAQPAAPPSPHGGPSVHAAGYGMPIAPPAPWPAETAWMPAPGPPLYAASPASPEWVAGDQLYPYDAQEPWMHGYFQEIPAYGGYVAFKPYNYKHVLSQSQAAGGWGMSPTMPYSHQFWHRYHQRATLRDPVEPVAP